MGLCDEETGARKRKERGEMRDERWLQAFSNNGIRSGIIYIFIY